MTCRYCGTELPVGALFCGECGQPVAAAAASDPAASAPAPAAAGFSIADLAFSSPGETSEPDDDDDERELPDGSLPDPSAQSGAASHCPQCGEAMAEGDVFCGECGFVVRTVSPPTGGEAESPEVAEAQDADATTEIDPLSDDDAPAAVDGLMLERDSVFAPVVADIDPDLEFDDPLPFSEAAATPVVPVSPRSRPIPDPFPWGTDQPIHEDLEATRLVAEPAPGTRYVLQFSTGESVTVTGSGLIGRNPSMQPGEYVDQLVPIFDAGKSVSKTHLEFGQEAGRFWVSDRYSTNGSVIRQPDADPRRCDAGRRYFIARGTRVDLGEQFFVVS
jgi:hypothetical protein